MPYDDIAQLPRGIQTNLSQAAQEIYREAYNEAWESCRYTKDRYDSDDSRQVTASKIAWETVKRHCQRDSWGRWTVEGQKLEMADGKSRGRRQPDSTAATIAALTR